MWLRLMVTEKGKEGVDTGGDTCGYMGIQEDTYYGQADNR